MGVLAIWRPPWWVFCTDIWTFWWWKYLRGLKRVLEVLLQMDEHSFMRFCYNGWAVLKESWPWLCTHEFVSFFHMWKTTCSLYNRNSSVNPFYTWTVRHFTLSKYCFHWLWDCKIKPFMSLHSGVWLHQACFS